MRTAVSSEICIQISGVASVFTLSLYLHKRVVDKRPLPRSLQDVVEVILEPPVPRVPATALRAVCQRLPQQAEPGALLPLRT